MIMGSAAERLTNRQQQYLAEQMAKVSRSFALVAPEVDAPLDGYLAVAYLICRVADNIEDARQTFSWQRQRYAEFSQLLDLPLTAAEVLAEWENHDWPGLSGDERWMMTYEGGLPLWEIYAGIPERFRSSIKRWASVMTKGMARANDPTQRDFFIERNYIRLPVTYASYNEYCFYVAGTVGHMISDLTVKTYEINGAAAKMMARDSEVCGRALQKTNIVKDFAQDLGRGVCYMPDEWLQEIDYSPLYLAGAPAFWKRKVLLDVVAELDASANFVLSLPQRAIGMRKAGLLMMMPAYETILLAAQRLPYLFTPDHAFKISRHTMGQCALKARKIARDNEPIRQHAQQMSAKIQRVLF